MEGDENPFANPNFRMAIGLMGALSIVFVAFFAIDDPTLRWILVGVAAVDAVATPYILKLTVENAEDEETGQYA